MYVENFSESDFIFARIQLREYMETGKDAGTDRDNPDREATPFFAGADVNDTSTWTVHTPGGAIPPSTTNTGNGTWAAKRCTCPPLTRIRIH